MLLLAGATQLALYKLFESPLRGMRIKSVSIRCDAFVGMSLWRASGEHRSGGSLICQRSALQGRQGAFSDPGVPTSAQDLLLLRRNGRWADLRSVLDWTRYHLQIAIVEHTGGVRSRIAAGMFERIASFHGCAGALPVEAATAQGRAVKVPHRIAKQLRLASYWIDREVDELDAASLGLYDVVVCIDMESRRALEVQFQGDEAGLPLHVVDAGDFGPYLELRKSESPIKAWVPDWREKLDPGYDERQAASSPPQDDALAIWHSMPTDLAQLVHPHYSAVSNTITASDFRAVSSKFGGDKDAASLAFHTAGLVRFLMDSYPLELQGGPGYIPI